MVNLPKKVKIGKRIYRIVSGSIGFTEELIELPASIYGPSPVSEYLPGKRTISADMVISRHRREEQFSAVIASVNFLSERLMEFVGVVRL